MFTESEMGEAAHGMERSDGEEGERQRDVRGQIEAYRELQVINLCRMCPTPEHISLCKVARILVLLSWLQ